ncbi:MAG: response regulator [Anaerolineales bacterium]
MNEPLHILIVDDDRRMARTLADILQVKGYRARSAYSGSEALETLRETSFDCVLSDIRMPDMDGVALYQAIRSVQPELPVVLMTAYASDDLVQEGLDEGVIAALAKPLEINLLLGFLSSLRKERIVIVVDDDPSFCVTLGDVLEARGYPVVEIVDPLAIIDAIKADDRIAVILNLKLTDTAKLKALLELRERFPQLPLILVCGYGKEMNAAIQASLKLNASTFLYKPLQSSELLQVLRELHHQRLGRILGNPGESSSEG